MDLTFILLRAFEIEHKTFKIDNVSLIYFCNDYVFISFLLLYPKYKHHWKFHVNISLWIGVRTGEVRAL